MEAGISVYVMRILASAAGLLAAAAQAAPFAYIAHGSGVSVIDVQTQTTVAEIATRAHTVHTAPGSSRAYAAGSQLSVIDTRAQGAIAAWDVSDITHFAVSPSAPILYATLNQYFGEPIVRVQVVSTHSGVVTSSFTLPGGAIGDVAFNAAGDLVMIANFSGQVHVLEAATGTELGSIPVTGFPEAIAVHPRLDRAYLPQLHADAVTVVDLRTRTVTAVVPVDSSPRFAVVNPAGTRVFVSHYLSGESRLSVIDTSTHQVVATIPVCGLPESMDITPDGEFLYVVCPNTKVEIVSTSALARVNSIAVPGARGRKGRFIGGPVDAISSMPDVLTGLWWQPAEPGWGAHLTQRRNTLFAVLFAYDGGASPRWHVAPECRTNAPLPCPSCVQDAICTGKVYEMAGPAFLHGFSPGSVSAREAGVAEFRFSNQDQGIMTMVIDGVHRSVAIARQPVGPVATSGTNYTDLWWNPAESGWGLGLTHQGANMFLTWFVYDDFGRPAWYVASNCEVNSAGDGCSGKLYRTTGAAFGPTFDPSRTAVVEVGTMSLGFRDRDNGTLNYVVGGVAGSKAITRQLF